MKLTAWISAICLLGISPLAAASLTKTSDSNWLTGADEKTRAERLEHYLGGFSSAMQDTGLRYAHVKQAIADGNWDLAQYHWGKIATAIENGLMKRPARRANAEAIFLNRAWEPLAAALKEKNGESIAKAFQQARQACMACHVAEKVPFMNDQPLFRTP
ncbi:hypothetical protein [Geoalkalibacter sp.]|uniref:hypothetical protein n=1 Tax=Geoalkalibacter sp. TaxID=3041440 RepID=UPI00272E5C05|nr:hypothetical protein [Geoalkalibacter sp.]